MELEELRKENEELKIQNENLVTIIENGSQIDEVDEDREEDGVKTPNTLMQENEQLVDVLRNAADEINELRIKYAEVVSQLNQNVKEPSELDAERLLEH